MENPQLPDPAKREELLAGLSQPAPPPRPAPESQAAFWIRKLFACNPFYLVSAALLLCGFYLVSSDANFPGREAAQFTFNFTALQFYELLLVATAILLARRGIWHDSTLLFGLENLLVLVPFVLVSQAAWISPQALWITSLVAAGMALARFVNLKRWFGELNLPRGLLLAGFTLLVVNVALPILFQHFNADKIGKKPTDGAAYELNRFTWLLVLPAMIALANLVPRPAQTGELLPQRRWLPAGVFALWLAASTVHLCFLGYVYNFDWEFLFLAPPLWAFAWTCQRRCGDFFSATLPRRVPLLPPALIALLPAADNAEPVFQILTALNIAFYAIAFLKNRGNWMALNLVLLSGAALGASFVKHLPAMASEDTGTGKWLAAFLAAYACYWIWRSRNPKLGFLGAFIVGIGSGVMLDGYSTGPTLAVQLGLLFFLLHSLVWDETKDASARAVRLLGCCLWLGHSAIVQFIAAPHAGAILCGDAAFVLIVCALYRIRRGHWLQPSLPVAAVSVLLLQPAAFAAGKLQSVPTGAWVVAGSFLLFACGTLAALTRSEWQRHPTPARVPAQTTPTNPPL